MARAGAHLGMSQSAVSQSIAALEHAMQVPLLDRTPRGRVATARAYEYFGLTAPGRGSGLW